MPVKPIPDAYHSVTPYLIVQKARKLIEFLQGVFDATVTQQMTAPDGRVMHAEVKLGDSAIMIADASPQWAPTSSALYVYVPDVDATYKRALQAGGAAVQEPATMFYGDRHGGVKDEFGNFWWIATHVEDVSQEELERRAAEQMKKQSSSS